MGAAKGNRLPVNKTAFPGVKVHGGWHSIRSRISAYPVIMKICSRYTDTAIDAHFLERETPLHYSIKKWPGRYSRDERVIPYMTEPMKALRLRIDEIP